MIFLSLPLLLCVVAAVTAAPAAVDVLGGMSEAQAEMLLRDLPNQLPRNSRIILEERFRRAKQRQLAKRTPQTTAGSLLTLFSAFWSTLQNWDEVRPVSKVPNVQDSMSPYWPGARRTKVRYGPYRVPAISEKNLESEMLKIQGLVNTFAFPAKRPCEGECTLLSLRNSLEYDDGSPATYQNGAWLHHTVLLGMNMKMKDATCNSVWEHLFESGNEKTVIDYAVQNSTIPTGYRFKADDTLIINSELMNMRDEVKWVWLTLTYDFYLEQTHPEIKDGHAVWMSIGTPRCGGKSDHNPFGKTNLTAMEQPTAMVMSEYSMPWTSPGDGFIMGLNGHLHEGGTNIEVFKEGEKICTSTPHYSHFVTGGMGSMSHSKRQILGPNTKNSEIEHIDKQGGCVFAKPLPMKKGDIMFIKANYDFTKHNGTRNEKGEIDTIMGIVGALVAFDPPLR